MEFTFEFAKYSIFTKVEGKGSPILLLHSYWGSHILFDYMAKTLSLKMQVIRIDLPGHGNSGTPPSDYSFEKFAFVLNELLTRLNVHEKVSIIGHSMGGYAALAFAAEFPERISSLILMQAPTQAADKQSIKFREREVILILQGKKDLLLQATISSNFAPENSSSMLKNIQLLYQTSSQVTLEGAVMTVFAINNRKNSLVVLQKSQYPILIIIGKYDKVYSAEDQLAEASQIPHAEVLMLNHSGNLGFLEEEDLVVNKIAEFLQGIVIDNNY